MQLVETIVTPLNRVKELASSNPHPNQAIVDAHPTMSWTMQTPNQHTHTHHDPWMTSSPSPSSTPPPPGMISESSESKRHHVPYPWGVNGGLWALPATTSNHPITSSSTPWTVSKDVHHIVLDVGTLIPKEIMFIPHAEDDDDVSVLNDDPDHDDEGILPQPTYDVLATLFHDIYKDGSEMEECDDDRQDVYDYHPDARAA